MKDHIQPHVPHSQKTAQRAVGEPSTKPVTAASNDTGLPDNLKSGIENLSGYSMGDVKVHYNSAKPATLQAHAYAQGTDIHVAPGQERHLPHEAWHVVQQKQGRVKATTQLKSIGINDSEHLESEADQMGAKALGMPAGGQLPVQEKSVSPAAPTVQRALETKDDIFIEQVKAQATRGLAILSDNAAEDEECESFATALRTNGVISPMLTFYGNQKSFLNKERNVGLAGITMVNLQNHGLIMEAVKLAEMKASWSEYKTVLDVKDIKKAGSVDGLGGNVQSDNSAVTTKVKWKAINGNAKEGQGVTALILAPDHPLGSTPSKDAKRKSQELSLDTKKPYIAGHLLNDHLGGPGNDQRNITALPKDVNTEQSDKIEEVVKKMVNADHKIAFYQVDVTYSQDGTIVNGKKHYYASALTSIFGVYKEGTDFSKLNFGAVPDAELNEKYVHVLPIEAPSAYGTYGLGYVEDNMNLGQYLRGGTTRKPDKQIDLGGNAAGMKVNQQTDVILKDDKQVKLEFISAAISSLQIRDLLQKIETLDLEAKGKGKQLDEKTLELDTLKKEFTEKTKLFDDLNVKYEEVKVLAQKEALAKQDLEGQNESLKKDNEEMEQRIQEVGAELFDTAQALKEANRQLHETETRLKETEEVLDKTKEESRFRMGELGTFSALTDKNPEEYLNTFFSPPSPKSKEVFFGNYDKQRQRQSKKKSPQKQRAFTPQINEQEEIKRGYDDGVLKGRTDGERNGYQDGSRNRDKDLRMFMFPMGGEVYQNSYRQGYEHVYSGAYLWAYDVGQTDYQDAYNYGFPDGDKGRNMNQDSYGYVQGFNEGMYNRGMRHGRLDREERKGFNPEYRNKQSYMNGYNQGHSGKKVKY